MMTSRRLPYLIGAALLCVVLFLVSGSRKASGGAEAGASGGATFVRGGELLDDDARAKASTCIIHQSWKTHRVPAGRMALNFAAWGRLHAACLHVLWNNSENLMLVERHYPEFREMYVSDAISDIQRADVARLLYLHRYGGVYADLDYEPLVDILAGLPEAGGATMFVVESPVLLNEAMQNSLMISRVPGEAFWRECVRTIQSIVAMIDHPERCDPAQLGSVCGNLGLFRNRLTRPLVGLVFTTFVSGPSVLDKTMALHGYAKGWKVAVLPADAYFLGAKAKHHQMSTWVSLPWALKELVVLLVGLLVLAAVAGGVVVRSCCSARRRF